MSAPVGVALEITSVRSQGNVFRIKVLSAASEPVGKSFPIKDCTASFRRRVPIPRISG